MQGLFSETIFGIPWAVLSAVALVVAAVYVVVDTGTGTEGLRWVVMRWFHPLCWLFLSSAALARSKATPLPAEWAGWLGALGGLFYLIFAIVWVLRSKG